MDKELMDAINEQADRAEKAKPDMLVRRALAEELHRLYEGRSVEKIEQKLEHVWRARGLFFATVHR